MHEEVNKTEAYSTDHVLLRMDQVSQATGMDRNQVYSAIKKLGFPRPVKIGSRAAAWVQAEVQNWISARITERDGASA
jgi:prophage regulatory protein